MDVSRYPIVELRRYTLHPGQRDVLIDLFDREFVESQEAEGMAILGQFRDLDHPDHFVWLRAFEDMATRPDALAHFYGGPVWKANSHKANATMVDCDDVLLLRPATPRSGFRLDAAVRPPVGHTTAPRSLILATVYHRDRPFDDGFTEFFEREIVPVLAEEGADPLAWLRTEYAENNFPALPVRTGEHVFVWFARLPDGVHLDDRLDRLERSTLSQAPQRFRLAPTARSLVR
jgi:quinol monooxygenase YgiN